MERAFGVLHARWEIVKNLVRQWDFDTISNIMMACIIMHNMITEDEQGLHLEPILDWGLREGHMRLELSFHQL